MDKNSVEKFQGEGHPVWFLGSWSDMPVKAKVIKICRDERAGEYAEVDCIHDDECYAFGSHSVHFDDLYPSKGDLLKAMFDAAMLKTAEIKASIQSKDDCIRYMFNHTVSCAEEYTDWTARRAIQQIAKERWGLDLE